MATSGIRAAIHAGLRLALAHHPLCDAFDGDVHILGRPPRHARAGAGPASPVPAAPSLRVCRGCAAAVAGLVAGLALAPFLLGAGAAPGALAAGALAFGLPQAATYLRRMPAGPRAAAKVLGGLGVGLLAVAGAAAVVQGAMSPGLAIAGGAALGALALAGQALRLRAVARTCDACPWRRRWDVCPGLRAHGGPSMHPRSPSAPGTPQAAPSNPL